MLFKGNYKMEFRAAFDDEFHLQEGAVLMLFIYGRGFFPMILNSK